ncbi:MAG: hypothetical protein Q4D38_03970, partial [Planctomycetia bacterium]|nr:hypothetical protein [Planctomycetia bacterium]
MNHSHRFLKSVILFLSLFSFVVSFSFVSLRADQTDSAPTPSPNALGSCWELFSSEEIRTWEQLAACKNADWVPIVLPQEARLPIRKIHWYRTKFEAPKLSENQHAFLCFDGVKFDAQVWVEGQHVGGYRGGAEPFEVEFTHVAKNGGAYELIVRVEGITSLLKEQPESLDVGPGRRLADNLSETVLYPIGSQGIYGCGIWEPIRLEIRDTLQINDLFIQTSWRQKKITVDFEVQNLTTSDVSFPVSADVEGTDIKFDTQTVAIPAGGCVRFRLERPWLAPRVWCPRDPFLYFLNVKMGDFATCRERFGFREVWCEGDTFVLNGVPFHALATAAHPRNSIVDGDSSNPAHQFFTTLRRANINCVRLHANYWPKGWSEKADELGMPIILETGFFCWVRAYALNDAEFWTNYDIHVRALQKKLRNSPSFCFFSLCNEILHCGGTYVCPDVEHLLAEAGRRAKTFDATRPISYDGDLDPEGTADVVNLHYPMDYAGVRKGNEDLDWPQDCWWMEKGKVVSTYPSAFWKWNRQKPFYLGELLHIQHFRCVDAYSLVLGDEAYKDGFGSVMARAKGKAWRMQVPAYRAAGVSGFCPWTLTEFAPAPTMDSDLNPRWGAIQDSYEPVFFALEPIPARVVEGSTIPARFWLLNDTDCVRDLTLSVRVGDLSQSISRRLNPAGRELVSLNLTIPKRQTQFESSENHTVCVELAHRAVVSEEKPEWNPNWELAGKMLPKGEDRFFVREGRVQREFGLWVEKKPAHDFLAEWSDWSTGLATAPRVGYIGAEDVARRFRAEWLKDMSDAKLDEVDVLIVGPNELKRLFEGAEGKTLASVGGNGTAQARLETFLKNPAHSVLILAQDEYPTNIFPIQLADTTHSDPRNSEWVQFPSVERPFLFPSGSAFEPMVVAGLPARFGGPAGFEYCPILRCGRLVLSQYPFEPESAVDAWSLRLPEHLLRAISRGRDVPQVCVYDESGTIQRIFDNLSVPYKTMGAREANG